MNIRNKYLAILVVVILASGGFWYYYKTQTNQTNDAPSTPEQPQLPAMATPAACMQGFKTYANESYGFSFCMPEDAEILPQFEAEDGSELDIIFVQNSDIEKLSKQSDYPDNTYLAVLKSGTSAFMLQRIKTETPSSEESLKQALPTQIPCPDKSLSCAESDMLNVKLLEWEKVPSDSLLFRYRDEVSAKKKWQDIGFIGANNTATFQIESIVPGNPINEQALKIMAESFR